MKFSLGLHLVLAGGLEAGGLLGVYKARATDFGAGDALTCPCWGSRGWGSRGTIQKTWTMAKKWIPLDRFCLFWFFRVCRFSVSRRLKNPINWILLLVKYGKPNESPSRSPDFQISKKKHAKTVRFLMIFSLGLHLGVQILGHWFQNWTCTYEPDSLWKPQFKDFKKKHEQKLVVF